MSTGWGRWRAGIAAALMVAGGPQLPALAEEASALKIIVPVGVGGALDQFARNTAAYLAESLDRPVTVENFEPKRGEDGYQVFLREPVDGSTVLAWFEPAAAAYGMSLDDLAIINVQEIEPPILAAHKATRWTTLRQMIEAVRKAPNHYRIGLGSRTGGGTLLTEALLANLGLHMTEVPFPSGGDARQALQMGNIDLTAGSLNELSKLTEYHRPLAVFAPRRLRAWPEVPTLTEALGPDADKAVSGAVYRFFAAHRRFAEERHAEFNALVEAFRVTTEENEAFRRDAEERGAGAHWFGPVESTSLLKRSHQHFEDLIAQQLSNGSGR